jgi:protein subunit release factor A
MVMDDNVEVRNNIAKITDDLKISLLPKDIDDDKNVILETFKNFIATKYLKV